ncbi:UNVERIFIED_CONTAM: hypothetical protein K2H54_056337 [Gekko kuhli]
MAFLQILLQPRNKAACSFVPLQCILTGLPKSQLFRHTSAGLIKAQGFHSSCCNWKKKKPPEPAPQELDLLRYDMKSLKDSPKPAPVLKCCRINSICFSAIANGYPGDLLSRVGICSDCIWCHCCVLPWWDQVGICSSRRQPCQA